MNRTELFWRAVGGRKQLNAYLAYITLVGMSFHLKPSFIEFAGAILLALGISGGLAAFEERKGSAPYPSRRKSDDTPDADVPEAS